MTAPLGPIALSVLVKVGAADPIPLAEGRLEYPPTIRQTLPEMLRALADDIEALPR